ncbi:hypothetical protein BC829DRAFT_260213 [Chytridium lagenaria]|nr:hypothetical protein BC829DRAFT_260213 [Chytridium lagenaria]
MLYADISIFVLDDAEVLYKTPNSGPDSYEYIDSFTPLASGKVYALTQQSKLYLFNADGSLDTSFADSGVLSLSPSVVFDGSTICYSADFATVSDLLFIADSCNNRILKFTASGVFVAALGMTDNTSVLSATPTTLLAVSYVYQQGYKVSVINPTTFTITSSVLLENAFSLDSIAALPVPTRLPLFRATSWCTLTPPPARTLDLGLEEEVVTRPPGASLLESRRPFWEMGMCRFCRWSRLSFKSLARL